MARILIVEDEPLIAKGLAAIINSINEEIKITITGFAEKALEYVKDMDYSMFLLDIQLKDYSGFDLAKEIRDIDKYKLTPIVFITAIPTRELVAFKEIHCYDYIIKPFKEGEVKKILETLINFGIETEEDTYIKLKQKEYSYLINEDEIIYIESINKRLLIVTINEEISVSTYTLKQLVDKLGKNFVRCHRGYIININFIEKIHKTENDVYLKRVKTPIPIGRKYKDYLRGTFYEFD